MKSHIKRIWSLVKQVEDSNKIQSIGKIAELNQHDPNPQECVGKVKTDLRF